MNGETKPFLSGSNDVVEDTLLSKAQSRFRSATYGIIFLLLKDAHVSLSHAVVGLFIELCQFLYFPFYNTAHFPWNSTIADVLAQFTRFFQISTYLEYTDWTTFLSFFYIGLALVSLVVTDALYVAYGFSRNKFNRIWPLRLLRAVCAQFATALFIPLLELFAFVFHCHKTEDGNFHHAFFHDVTCWQGLYLFHATMAIIVMVCFVILAIVVAGGYYEQSLLSPNVMARCHGRLDMLKVIVKTLLVVVFIFYGTSEHHWLLLALMTVGVTLLLFFHLHNLPYYNFLVCQLRSASLCLVTWCIFCLFVSLCNSSQQYNGSGALMLVAAAPLVVYFAVNFTERRRQQINTSPMHHIHRAADYELKARFLLLASRHVYRHLLESEHKPLHDLTSVRVEHETAHEPDPSATHNTLAHQNSGHALSPQPSQSEVESVLDSVELVYRKGLERFPRSAFLHVHYAIFLIHLRKNKRKALVQLSRAEHSTPKADESFMIYRHRKYIQDQTKTYKHKLNVVAYIAYENHMLQLQRYMEKSAVAQSSFWSELLSDCPDLGTLYKLGAAIHRAVTQAETQFRLIAAINPQSAKAMRLFGSFANQVLNDAETGDSLLRMAEEAEEHGLKEHTTQLSMGESLFNGRNHAMVISGEQERLGELLKVSAESAHIFGSSKKYLIGRNISSLLHAPYSSVCMDMLRLCLESGQQSMFEKPLLWFGIHQHEYILPISVMIRQIPDPFAAVSFLVVIELSHSNSHDGYLTVGRNGIITGVSKAVQDIFHAPVAHILSLNPSITQIIPEFFAESTQAALRSSQGLETAYRSLLDDSAREPTSNRFIKCSLLSETNGCSVIRISPIRSLSSSAADANTNSNSTDVPAEVGLKPPKRLNGLFQSKLSPIVDHDYCEELMSETAEEQQQQDHNVLNGRNVHSCVSQRLIGQQPLSVVISDCRGDAIGLGGSFKIRKPLKSFNGSNNGGNGGTPLAPRRTSKGKPSPAGRSDQDVESALDLNRSYAAAQGRHNPRLVRLFGANANGSSYQDHRSIRHRREDSVDCEQVRNKLSKLSSLHKIRGISANDSSAHQQQPLAMVAAVRQASQDMIRLPESVAEPIPDRLSRSLPGGFVLARDDLNLQIGSRLPVADRSIEKLIGSYDICNSNSNNSNKKADATAAAKQKVPVLKDRATADSKGVKAALINGSATLFKSLRRHCFVLIVFIMIVASVNFAVLFTKLQEYKTDLSLMNASASRRYYAANIKYHIRGLTLVHENYLSDSILEDTQASIDLSASQLAGLQNVIMQHSSKFSSVLADTYDQAVTLTESHNEQVSIISTNRLESVQMYLNSALSVVNMLPAQAVATTMDNVYFVLHNEPLLMDLFQNATDTFIRENESRVIVATKWLLAIMCAALILFLLLILWFFIPVIFQLETDKLDVLTLFVDLPKTNVEDMMNRCENWLLDQEENESEEGFVSRRAAKMQQQNLHNNKSILISNQLSEEKSISSSGLDDEWGSVEAIRLESYCEPAKVIPNSRRPFKRSSLSAKRGLLLKFFGLYVVVCFFFVFSYVKGNMLFQEIFASSAEINLASDRRARLEESIYNLRELFVTPGQHDLRSPESQAAASQTNQLETIEHALVYGSTQFGTEALVGLNSLQDQLIFGDACSVIDSTSVVAPRMPVSNQTAPDLISNDIYNSADSRNCSRFGGEIMTRGSHAALLSAIKIIRDVLVAFDTSRLPSLNARKAAMTSPQLAYLFNLVERHLQPALQMSSQFYLADIYHKTDEFMRLDSILLGFFLLFMPLLYVTFYHPSICRLEKQMQRTRAMLLMLPSEVLDRIPSIGEFLQKHAALPVHPPPSKHLQR